MENESGSLKRKRAGKEEFVDKALKEWFLQVRGKNARINGIYFFMSKSRMGKNKN